MNLNHLNNVQKAAVTAQLGPILVIAGAGSGKTRVLTHRVAYIIEQGWVRPENILAVTFTNKAASELRHRLETLLSEELVSQKPTMGTFHSLGARILRKEIYRLGFSANFTIIDAEDQIKLLKDILKTAETPERFSIGFFKGEISRAKNLLQTPDTLDLPLEPEVLRLVKTIYTHYSNELYKQNLVDFDDLLFLPTKIFLSQNEILEKYRKKFSYILVDEYQDTNHAQYVFLKLLADKGNIYVVGDDAQSIYGFRGSNIENILNFEKDFPNARVFKLEQNYRSTKHILNVAQEVIEMNADQKPKVLWTENEAGDKVWVEEVENEYAEAVFVVKSIIQIANGSELQREVLEEEEGAAPFSILDQFLKKNKSFSSSTFSFLDLPKLNFEHLSLSEFCILFRTHAQSRALEETLVRAGLPYKIVGGLRFYERKEIKDCLAYLRLLQNLSETLSLKRIINIPARGLGEKSSSVISEYISSVPKNDLTYDQVINYIPFSGLGAKQRTQALNFFSELKKIYESENEKFLSDILRVIIKTTGLDKYYKGKTETGEDRFENILELVSLAKRFDSLPWKEGLENFLEDVALVTEIENDNGQDEAVSLMTLHAVKGLEFDTVFFVGLEEGLMPHSRSLFEEKELAEEFRLAYVGMTRARKKLILVYAKTRTVYGDSRISVPSRILKVLPESSLDLGNKNLNEDDTELIYEDIDF